MNQMVPLSPSDPADLPNGTRLLTGQYEILYPLQQGGFGITYVARDSLDRQVVIKECFPARICERAGDRVRPISPMFEPLFLSLKQQFIREARRMATLRHPNIVAVHQVFEENNSAYMALDYVVGIDLITVLEEEPARVTPAFVETALRQALAAVAHIHGQGMLHRDIAPDNIRVGAGEQVTLIDFGASCERSTNREVADNTPPAVKDGYSPHEFYRSSAAQDFCSDLYSLGATFYHLITGEAPMSAYVRRMAISSGADDPHRPLAAGDWDFGHHLLASIDQALAVEKEDRPQSAQEWLEALDALPRERPAVAADPVEAVDPDIEIKLARLVEETNSKLGEPVAVVAAPWGTPRRREVPQPRLEPEGPKQWVDMFGAPIEDLASWESEQARAARLAAEAEALLADQALPDGPDGSARDAALSAALEALDAEGAAGPDADPAMPDATEPAHRRERRSFIGGLVSRFLLKGQEFRPA